MALFRAKPREVEAIQWTGDNAAAIEAWLGDDNGGCLDYFGILRVGFTEGSLQLEAGDWITRHRGDYHRETDAEFTRSFEPASAPPRPRILWFTRSKGPDQSPPR